jgi:4-hydroxythreonine-4-phosphate dehydrogenase
MKKPIIISMGDPAGIGPEIILKALLRGGFDQLGRPVLVAGDVTVLQRAAQVLTVKVRVIPGEPDSVRILQCGERRLSVRDLSALAAADWRFGVTSSAAGAAMAEYVEWGLRQCLDNKAAALVTCPISKAAINAAGVHFPGHTELLAERCGRDKVVMMLAGERLRVGLVTTHLGYSEVPKALSEAEIFTTLQIVDRALREDFGLEQPRLGVLALNPHAGEGGLFGREEQELIAPAIARAQAAGIHASGPHSADTYFHFAVQGAADAVICMYHDQGLIPLKLLHFDDAVNVTLGLPIIRTSVDHGTAYDLAGTGQASPASLIAALRMADAMARTRG